MQMLRAKLRAGMAHPLEGEERQYEEDSQVNEPSEGHRQTHTKWAPFAWKTCSDCVLGIILLSSWIAEIDQDPVAHVLGDVALMALDHFGYAAMICSDDLAEVSGSRSADISVEPTRSQNKTVS